MADKKPFADDKQNPPPDPPPPAPPAPPTPPDPNDPILQQGTPPDNVPEKRTKKGEPGRYKVIHGSITFAPGKVAYPGAIVNLGAEDAGLMVEAGTVEPV